MQFHQFVRAFITGALARFSAVNEDHTSTELFRYYTYNGVCVQDPPETLDGVISFCRYQCCSERRLLKRFEMQEWTHDEVIEIHKDCARIVDKYTWLDVCSATHDYTVRTNENGHIERRDCGTWTVDYNGMRLVQAVIKDNMESREKENFNNFIKTLEF